MNQMIHSQFFKSPKSLWRCLFSVIYVSLQKRALDKKKKKNIEQLKQLCITKDIMVFTDMQLLLIDLYR